METVPTPQNVTLTGNVLLYRQPELLSREQHGKLGINPPPTRFGFAATTHLCPITVPEFGPASLTYPIIFVGQDYHPVVVFGLQEGQNLFATPEAGFEVDAYIPCYVRRYPFVLAAGDPAAANEQDQGNMLVGIDRGYEFLVEGAQFPLFDKKGEPTDFTKQCIQFCNDFETQHRMTQAFVKLLRDLELLETRTMSYTPQNPDGTPGEPVNLAQFFAVSEAKLNELPSEKLVELRANGALAQIYAHLNSLFGWERLMIKAMARAGALPDPKAVGAV